MHERLSVEQLIDFEPDVTQICCRGYTPPYTNPTLLRKLAIIPFGMRPQYSSSLVISIISKMEFNYIQNDLTLIITTSPTPSTPATDLVEAIISSFEQHCPDLLKCRIIVILDTFERIASVLRLKKGRATPEVADAYDQYKRWVKNLILEKWKSTHLFSEPTVTMEVAEYGSPGQNHTSTLLEITDYDQVMFIEPRDWIGFGLGVRSALRCVKTPYVWVNQHDWALDSSIPVKQLIDVMKKNDQNTDKPVKYICLPSIRMLGYASSMLSEQHPTLRQLTAKLKGLFAGTDDSSVVPLTPMFFWHDKTHLASTQHYLQRVFPSRLAMARGAFIEDTIGHRARDQMKEGNFKKWATWMYYPGDGKVLCLRHLDGRMWKGIEYEAQRQHEIKQRRREKAELRAAAKLQKANDIHDIHGILL